MAGLEVKEDFWEEVGTVLVVVVVVVYLACALEDDEYMSCPLWDRLLDGMAGSNTRGSGFLDGLSMEGGD